MICLYPTNLIISFLWQCEANILVALIEGCVGGGGVSGDVVTSCCWIVGNGCLFKLLLIFLTFLKKIDNKVIDYSLIIM